MASRVLRVLVIWTRFGLYRKGIRLLDIAFAWEMTQSTLYPWGKADGFAGRREGLVLGGPWGTVRRAGASGTMDRREVMQATRKGCLIAIMNCSGQGMPYGLKIRYEF